MLFVDIDLLKADYYTLVFDDSFLIKDFYTDYFSLTGCKVLVGYFNPLGDEALII